MPMRSIAASKTPGIILPAIVFALTLGCLAVAPARADDDGWRRDRGGHEWREHEWRERHRPVYVAPGYYAPGYAYAPPVVVYRPAPVYAPPPGISLVVPLTIR